MTEFPAYGSLKDDENMVEKRSDYQDGEDMRSLPAEKKQWKKIKPRDFCFVFWTVS